MKHTLIYSLKVWLTTILIAPLLGVRGLMVDNDSLISFLVFYPRVVLGGVMESLLSIGMLFVSILYINKLRTSTVHKKAYFTLLSLGATFLSFYLYYGLKLNSEEYYAMIAYGLVTIVSIWLYKLASIIDTPNPQSNLNPEL